MGIVIWKVIWWYLGKVKMRNRYCWLGRYMFKRRYWRILGYLGEIVRLGRERESGYWRREGR